MLHSQTPKKKSKFSWIFNIRKLWNENPVEKKDISFNGMYVEKEPGSIVQRGLLNIEEKTVHELNKELKVELWARGYYVQEVGQLHAGEIDYLIVSCAKPKNATKEWVLQNL